MGAKKNEEQVSNVISLEDYKIRKGLLPKGSPFMVPFDQIFKKNKTKEERIEEERKDANQKVLEDYKLKPRSRKKKKPKSDK